MGSEGIQKTLVLMMLPSEHPPCPTHPRLVTFMSLSYPMFVAFPDLVWNLQVKTKKQTLCLAIDCVAHHTATVFLLGTAYTGTWPTAETHLSSSLILGTNQRPHGHNLCFNYKASCNQVIVPRQKLIHLNY